MRLISLALSRLLLVLPVSAETVRRGDRYYDIQLPANPRGAPLLLVLHGGGGNPDRTERLTGLTRLAVGKGYAVAYPAGTGRRLLSWNAGYCCAGAARNRVGDEAFLARVIADAQGRFALGDRVYVTGMSNGSMMAETFAALAGRSQTPVGHGDDRGDRRQHRKSCVSLRLIRKTARGRNFRKFRIGAFEGSGPISSKKSGPSVRLQDL